MLISSDFFSFFRSLSGLFDIDPKLYCISAWNDNGIAERVRNPQRLYRTDCFPGLGWMMNRKLWNELGKSWASGFWDDWLRLPTQRKGRSCVFPEINRVYTFGSDGTSGGQFFNHLQKIKLNEPSHAVDFSTYDLSVLVDDAYKANFLSNLKSSKFVNVQELRSFILGHAKPLLTDLRTSYGTLAELDFILTDFSLMTDHKNGIPRTSYMGVVLFPFENIMVYLAPNSLEL